MIVARVNTQAQHTNTAVKMRHRKSQQLHLDHFNTTCYAKARCVFTAVRLLVGISCYAHFLMHVTTTIITTLL